MSYTVDQKIGKYIYVYEVESYWDPQKKQPRQKRRYLGKRDAQSGEILTPYKGITPRAARDYGQIYLLEKLAERIGLLSVLRKVFPEEAEVLAQLAFFQVCEARPLYLFKAWVESTYFAKPADIGSQKMSRFLRHIGQMDRQRDRFFELWVQQQGDIRAIVFDITSLSSYSKFLEPLEWGYNRDGEKLPQINFGLILGQPSNLPLTYSIYPGSIADVSTLKNILEKLKVYGVSHFTFVLDRGFYSSTNIKEMQGITLVIPMPFTTRVALELLAKHTQALSSPLSGFYFMNRALFHIRREIKLGGVDLYAHLYLDEKRRAQEIEHFIGKLVEIERQAEEKKLGKKQDVEHYTEELSEGCGKLFQITVQQGRIQLKRKAKVISSLLNRMGKMILLTNDGQLKRDELLLWYHRKDSLEKLFDIMKNELEEGRLWTGSKEAMQGRLFVNFLSIVLYAALSQQMKEAQLYQSFSVSEVLYELKKLKLVELSNGKSLLTEISKRQRILYQKLNVPIPAAT